MSGVVTRPSTPALARRMSWWYEPVWSRRSSVWPVGAVSMTTCSCRPRRSRFEKATNTASSSVHGERRSSSRRSVCSGVEVGGACEFGIDVALGLRTGVDPARRQAAAQGFVETSCGVGAGQVGGASRCGEPIGERLGDSGLADASLAHDHHDTRSGLGEISDERTEVRQRNGRSIGDDGFCRDRAVTRERSERTRFRSGRRAPGRWCRRATW